MTLCANVVFQVVLAMRKKKKAELDRLGQLGCAAARKELPKNAALVKVFLDPVFKSILMLVRR